MKKLLLLFLAVILQLSVFAQVDNTPSDDLIITRVIDVRNYADVDEGQEGKVWSYTAVEMYAIKDIDRDNYQFTFSPDAGTTVKIKSLQGGMFAKYLADTSDFASSEVSPQILPAGSFFYAVEMYRVDAGATYIPLSNGAFYRIINATMGSITSNQHFSVATGSSTPKWADFYNTISNADTWVGLKASDLDPTTPVFTAFDQWVGPLANNKFDKRESSTPNPTFNASNWTRNQDSSIPLGSFTLDVDSFGKFSETIIIYPNPTSQSKVFISNWEGSKNVTVFDIAGKEIRKQIVENELDVSEFSKGIYILKINQDNKSAIKRLIIK